MVVGGKPHYPLTPEEMTRWLMEFIRAGRREHRRRLLRGPPPSTSRRGPGPWAAEPPSPARRAWSPAFSSPLPGRVHPPGQQLFDRRRADQANGSRRFRELLAAEDVDGMVRMAKEQVKAGSTMIDVCGAYVGRDELADMRRIVSRFATEVPVPLMIDSTEAPVIEASLEPGRRQVHRPTASTWKTARSGATTSCPSAASSGPPCRSHHRRRGHGQDRDRKVAIARRIYRLATEKYGIAPGDLLFDPLTFTICTGNEDDRRLGLETLEGIRRIKQEMPACHIARL